MKTLDVDVLRTDQLSKINELVSVVSGTKNKSRQLLYIVYTLNDDSCIQIEVKRGVDDIVQEFVTQGLKESFAKYVALKYNVFYIKFVATSSGIRNAEAAKVTKREAMRYIGDVIDAARIKLLVLQSSFQLETSDTYNIQLATYITTPQKEYIARIEATPKSDDGDITTTDVATRVRTFMRRFESKSSKTPSRSSSAVASVKSSKTSSSSSEKQEWILPNRVGFAKWMYKTFHPEKYATEKNTGFFPQQRLIQDVLTFQSPYRGLLLYHGLGVGKTCASIAAAEGFLQRHKKIFVLVPASLAQNYKNEIMRCASIGNPTTKRWNIASVPGNEHHSSVKRIMSVYNVPYDFVKKHHTKLWFTDVTDGVSYSRRNLAWSDLNEVERAELQAFLFDYIETKYTFISYNGATKKTLDALGPDPFNDAFIVMDEAHNFISRVVNGGKIARRIFNMIMSSERSKMIFLTGTPVINHPYELCVLLNLVRGSITEHVYSVPANANVPSYEDIVSTLESKNLMKYIDMLQVATKRRTISVQYLPTNFVMGSTSPYIKSERWQIDVPKAVHEELIRAYNIDKKVERNEHAALPITKETFEATFLDESDPDKPTIKNMDVFVRRILGLVSYFKTAGEEYFPSVLPRVVEKVPMSGYQFSEYVDVRDKERQMEMNKKRQNAVQGGVFSKKGTVYRAFSRMACNFVFPEYIERPFPGELRKQLEKEISTNEEDEDAEDEEERDIKKEVQKKYEHALKTALSSLQSASQKPLAQTNLAAMYSPKFAHMVKDVTESPGSCLLYSQFRKVEGLGIMRMVLEEAGFAEIEVEKHGGAWVIANADKVFQPMYNGKRFAVFNEDREKTNLLIKLFNGAVADLPPSIVEQLPQDNNLYGDMVKVIMISQSGAEGISLKNVRRVLIAEPFWNKVRIDQVIGRAIRAGSHLSLPPEHRNVQVFIYMSAFTPEQLKSNFTLQRLDKGHTSDQHIFDIAEQKSRIIDAFLDMLKRAAMDCINHATKNTMLSSGMQCYAFPINMPESEFAFTPSLKADVATSKKQKMERVSKIRGRVVSREGKKYVVVDGLDGYFDYAAYKDGGVLVATSF